MNGARAEEKPFEQQHHAYTHTHNNKHTPFQQAKKKSF